MEIIQDQVIRYRSVRWTFHSRNLFYFLVEVQDASYKAYWAQNMLDGANDTSKERITEQTGALGQICEMEYMDAFKRSRLMIDEILCIAGACTSLGLQADGLAWLACLLT